MLVTCQISKMSRILHPCWRFGLHYDKILLGNYQTNAMTKVLYSCWQSSNHFRVSASPVGHRCVSGARFFPSKFGDSTSNASLESDCVPDDAKFASSEDPFIGSTSKPTDCSSSSKPESRYTPPEPKSRYTSPKITPYVSSDGNARLSTKNDEILDNREKLAVGEDEAIFLDDFNRDLPSIKPIKQPDDYWASLHPLEKDLFNPTPQLHARSAEVTLDYVKKYNITVTGEHNLPPLICSFEDYNFPTAFVKLLQEHFTAPTPVQAIGWTAALKGYDIVGLGQSGTGKTLGYLVPALLHISHHMKAVRRRSNDQAHYPLGLVVAPTRELVDQIVKVAQEYGPSIGVLTASLIGGSSRDLQVHHMRRHNTQLLVSTPSRVIELIQNGSLSLDHCGLVVVDEADKMLDSTMEPQIRTVLAHTRPGRQTMLWSATWPEPIRQLALELLSDPLILTVGSTSQLPSSSVTQHVHFTELHNRRDLLRRLLREHFEAKPKGRALVFAATTDEVEKLKLSLRRCSAKFSVESYRGGTMLQRHRNMILEGFRRDYFSVLVATDLASRGLDIPGLSCVVNYDFPKNIETYIHRVGRTGRHGERGVAHSFFCQRDAPKAKQLMDVLTMSGQHVDSRIRYLAAKEDLPESMKEKYIPFVPLKDRFGNPLVQSESRLAGGMKERVGPIKGSAREQAFQLRNEAKREVVVAHLKTKPHVSRHVVEHAPRPRAAPLRRRRTK